jgi:hypothetical protein
MPDGQIPKEHVDKIPDNIAGVDLDNAIRDKLAEMGLTEDDVAMVVEGAGGITMEGHRWRLCPRCKSNIDMMVEVPGADGVAWPKILPKGCVECPNCGCYGEQFGMLAEQQPHPKLRTLKARAITITMPDLRKHVQQAKSVIEDLGLFPTDPHRDSQEPHWPRDLAAAILAGAMIVRDGVDTACNEISNSIDCIDCSK